MLAFVLVLLLVARDRSLSAAGFLAVFLAAVVAGLGIGATRIEAMQAGALSVPPGGDVELTGHLLAPPKTSSGVTRSVLGTPEGKVFLEAADLPAGIGVGDQIQVEGSLSGPATWQAARLKMLGTQMVLKADRATATGEVRGGLPGLVDGLRRRAEETLALAMPEREAALARGFVLGQDQDIPAATVRDFRDSGLAHLLAVSGQNVILLCLLAVPFFALIGLQGRARIATLAFLIIVYIPVAGGGPSIQRAGVMGLAALAAASLDRPVMRAWSLCLAAAVTLALNPFAASDPGWQLSFAAVIGIAMLSAPVAERIMSATGGDRGSLGRALADGFGVTLAATVSTLPLIALHFERIPIATVAANLLAMPAVAPSMWLGMTAAFIGQFLPVLAVPLNLVNSILLGFIAQVAVWFGGQEWSAMSLGLESIGMVAAAYLVIGLCSAFLLIVTRPSPVGTRRFGPAGPRLVVVTVAFTVLVGVPLLAGLLEPGRRNLPAPPPGGARIDFLDVGQGDSILIRSEGRDPVLVDFGPPDGGVVDALRSASVKRLSGAVLTHMDLDHAGGLFEVLESARVETLLHDEIDRRVEVAARRVGTDLRRVSEGDRFRLGALGLEVLWPPRRTDSGPIQESERNARSIVLMVTWRNRRILLTGDAESEEVPLEPGLVDVLKVAHHGSDDEGLERLLAISRPDLAIISAGDGNSYGHPTGEVLEALDRAGTRTLRTDRQGTLSLVFDGRDVSLETGR